MHSFKPPILDEYWANGMRYWSFGDHAVITDNYIELNRAPLTGSSTSQSGYLWNRHPNHAESFDINVTVSVLVVGAWLHGAPGGMAIWYTSATPRHIQKNSFFGGLPKFEGLGIVYDHTGAVNLVVNNGEELVSPQQASRGSCIVPLTPVPVTFWVQYNHQKQELNVMFSNDGASIMIECATAHSVKLPARNYFGVTGLIDANSQATHVVHSFFVKPLRKSAESSEEEESEKESNDLFNINKDKEEQVAAIDKE